MQNYPPQLQPLALPSQKQQQGQQEPEPKETRFTETVGRIIDQVNCREDEINHHEPLTYSEILHLSELCSVKVVDEQDLLGFADVDADMTEQLLGLLEKHVAAAASINLVEESLTTLQKIKRHEVDFSFDRWLNQDGRIRLVTLKAGLEAASIILHIINTPGIDRRVVNEDAIEGAIVLFRHNLSKNILPALNNVGHIDMNQSKDGATTAANMTPAKKRRRSSAAASGGGSGKLAVLIKEMKKSYKFVQETIGITILVMERLDSLIQKIPLDDQQILMISSGALSSLELDPTTDAFIKTMHQLHVATLGVVTSIFRRYPRHRHIIIEDLFPVMLRMPTSKKCMRTYPIRCSSNVLYPEGLQSLSKTLAPGNVDPKYIQTISAMILSLVQSSVTRPIVETEGDSLDGNEEPATTTPIIHSGLRDCISTSDLFVSLLIQRCSKKGEDGGASEFRPILSNLIDDLLLVVLIPEYPAAEMILMSIGNLISSDMVKASHPKNIKKVEDTYLSTAFDALGKLCAAEARILKSNKEKPVRHSTVIRKPDEKHVECYCTQNSFADELMLNCDRCNCWFHGACVGLSRDTVPVEWHCDSCQLSRIVEFEQLRNRNMGDYGCPAELIDQGYSMRRLLVDYLSIVSSETGMARVRDAYEFHLARWIRELSPQENGNEEEEPIMPLITRLMEFWYPHESSDLDSQGSTLSGMLHCLSDEGRSRIVIHLSSTQSNLMLSFRRQVGLIVKLMESNSSSHLRKLAVKAVEKVTDADRGYMTHPIVKKAVIGRFSDDSISVREAAVSLVGSYVVHLPEVVNDFHPAFMVGLNDPGVSVRKRTIKILQDILSSNPAYTSRAAACSEMLRLAADPKEDDGVRDLIYDLFLALWLENGDAMVMHVSKSPIVSPSSPDSPASPEEVLAEDHSIAGVVTPGHQVPFTPMTANRTRSTARRIKSRRMQIRSEIAAEQMVEVVKNAGSGEGLTNLFRELLQEVSDSDKNRKASERKKRQVLAQGHCSMLVDALVEHLLTTEENREKFAAIGLELVAIFRTIVVFAEVSPLNVVKHLDTLLPYLKADNGLKRSEEEILVSSLCNAISKVAKFLERNDVERLDGNAISKDMANIIYNLGSKPCSAAVEALSSLSHHRYTVAESPFRTQILKLAKRFYNYMMKHRSERDIVGKAHGKEHAKRALTVLGFICRYHEVSDDKEEINLDQEDEENPTPMGIAWSNLIALCKLMFQDFLELKDPQIKCAALEALSGVFIARPRVMLNMDESGLITDVMARNMHNSVQLTALRCWREILLTEEARIETGEARRVMESKKSITVSKKISGDQDADATLFGGVLTNHSARLFEMTQARDVSVRFAALDLVGHLLRQGQLNPNEATPFLFALQGDVEEDRIRSLALKLLMTEGEKRPDMLRQRACAGVKQAYLFQQAIYPDKEAVSALVGVKRNGRTYRECVLGSVYKECIASIKKQRLGLFRDLLSRFATEKMEESVEQINGKKKPSKKKSSKKSASSLSTDLALLSFTAQVLVHLPLTSAYDPLYIINKINGILALQGPDMLDRLACFLRPYGLSSSDEMDENNLTEDAIEIAAHRNTPHHAKEVTRLLEPDFDTAKFLQLCCDAGSLTLLLRMKEFLKNGYNISETRIMEYNPEVKIQDRPIGRLSPSNTFDGYLPLQKDADKQDLDGMIAQYAEFRRRMRAETSSDLGGQDDPDDEGFSDDEEPDRKRRRHSSAAENHTMIE